MEGLNQKHVLILTLFELKKIEVKEVHLCVKVLKVQLINKHSKKLKMLLQSCSVAPLSLTLDSE